MRPSSQPDTMTDAWLAGQRTAFAACRDSLPGSGTPWVDALRAEAFRQFEEDGPPTARIEEWRSGPTTALTGQVFAPAAPDGARAAAVPAPYLEGPRHRLVFVDGRFSRNHSDAGEPPEGVRLTTLSALLAENPQAARDLIGDPDAFAEERLSRVTDRRPQALVALNTALASDGAVLLIEDGVALAHPLEVVHVARETEEPRAHHLRTLIALGAGARAHVVEVHAGGSAGVWTNHVTDIAVGAGARLEHVRADAGSETAVHVNVAHARLRAGAAYAGFVLAATGGAVRTETRLALEEPGADGEVNGVCLARESGHIDALTRLDHHAPEGTSRQLWRGIFADTARGAFQGRIRVLPDASGTNAALDNRNLLLNAGARAESKPELEILTDDVACSHASATGELDADALFYLRSRGLSEQLARALLMEAFTGAVADRIAHEGLREFIRRLVDDRLHALGSATS